MMMTAENKEKQNFFLAKDVARIVGTKETPLGFVASLPLTRESAVCVRILALLDDDDLFCATLDLVNQPTAHCRRRSGKKYRLLSQFSILTKTFWTKRGKKTKGQSHGKWLNRASGDVGTARNNWNTLKREGYARHLVYSSLFQLTRKSSFNNILSLTLAWKKKTNNRFFFFDIHSTRSIQGFHTNMTHCGISNDSEGEPVEILLYTTS